MKKEDDRGLLRLEPDVLSALEKIGPYWQVQANEVLRQVFVSDLRMDEFELPAFARRNPLRGQHQ
jgi:hypothetical protein